MFFITLLLVMAYGGYYFYYQKNILPYKYWYQLIEKDPKPSNVSLEEYQRKNRQGFCWRDQKYYTPDELKQKAMLSWVEDVLLAELNLHKAGEVLSSANMEPIPYYSDDCKRGSLSCRLWLIPKAYTTQELIDLHQSNPELFNQTLFESNKVQIHGKDDVAQLPFNGSVNQNILISVDVYGADLYPSDCCTIKSHQEMMGDGEEWELYDGIFTGYPYKGYAIPDLNTQDYGIGNYFLETTGISQVYGYSSANKFTYAYFLNNCGDVLFKPHYYWR